MLKIKDNVDLKELEKFGLKYHATKENQRDHYSDITHNEIYTSSLHICIWCKDKRIMAYDNEGIELLFDLINAGLVEKGVD